MLLLSFYIFITHFRMILHHLVSLGTRGWCRYNRRCVFKCNITSYRCFLLQWLSWGANRGSSVILACVRGTPLCYMRHRLHSHALPLTIADERWSSLTNTFMFAPSFASLATCGPFLLSFHFYLLSFHFLLLSSFPFCILVSYTWHLVY